MFESRYVPSEPDFSLNGPAQAALHERDRFIMTEERMLSAIASEGLTPSPRGLSAYYRNGVSHPAMAQAVGVAT